MIKKKHNEFEEVKPSEDLKAVRSFLQETDLEKLKKDLQEMQEIMRDGEVVDHGLKTRNIKKKIKLFEQVLQEYDFLQNDVDINGIRLRKIAQNLLKDAKKAGLKETVKEKKKDFKWRV